jgi:hypothetical protein
MAGKMNLLRIMVLNHVPRGFLYFAMAFVINPLGLLSLRVAVAMGRMRHLQIGKLSLWGDADFLELCRSSLDRLNALDPGFYQILTEKSEVHIVQDATGSSGEAAPFLFVVGSHYLAWKSDGMIARLVYVGFCVSGFSMRQTWDKNFPNVRKEVMAKSRSWLERQCFPPELVECYAGF